MGSWSLITRSKVRLFLSAHAVKMVGSYLALLCWTKFTHFRPLLMLSSRESSKIGILWSPIPLWGSAVLLQPKTAQASGMIPEEDFKRSPCCSRRSSSFDDVTITLGPILHRARLWPQEPPKFETLKNSKKNKEKRYDQNFFAQVSRMIRKFRSAKKKLGGLLHFNGIRW